MDVSPITLMVIGMVTVFVVLILVVLSGNLIINLVNKFIPEDVPKPTRAVSFPPIDTIEKNKLSAIVAAVEYATKGKGKVTKIEQNK